MLESPEQVEPEKVAIAVATFNRQRQLAQLLPLLVEQAERAAAAGTAAEIIVVDNDPSGSASSTVADFTSGELPVPLHYVHEPKPGISAARNAALDAAVELDFLAFIDDDEVPSEHWLTGMLATRAHFDAAAVVGPVIARFEREPDEWVQQGKFFLRPRWPTGTVVPVGYTSNILLDLRRVRRLHLRFDVGLGLTGGEDTLFTTILSRDGGPIVFCDEAEVYDLVPVERLDHRWILRRRFRFGTVRSLVALKAQDATGVTRTSRRLRLTGQGAIRVAGGAARVGWGYASGSVRNRAQGMRTLAQGAGLAAGAWGHVHEEYRRDGQDRG